MLSHFYPHFMMEKVPCFMKRMLSWYTRTCRLRLLGMWARYNPDIFGAKADGANDIKFDFQDIQNMFCHN